MSPSGRLKGMNGVATHMDKGKARMREDDGESSPEGFEAVVTRESAVSPDGGRAKSPALASRAVSPTHVVVAEMYDPAGPQASLASVIMSRSAAGARSPSPTVRPPVDGLFKPASPTVNGFAKPGSTGNLTADLIRDLKDREAEIETLKKKESWMKAALLKAERSGFIYAETEEELSSRADDDDIDGRRVTEMVINLKQLKAKIQVCHLAMLYVAHDADVSIGDRSRARQGGLGARAGSRAGPRQCRTGDRVLPSQACCSGGILGE